MIPAAKQQAVNNALQITFGTTAIDDVTQLTVGLSSALIFKIVIAARPYLLRVIMRDDAMANPAHYYQCMQIAADAGVAPRVWYAGVEDRISITDFIERKHYTTTEARPKVALMLQHIHGLPAFPFRINYLDAMHGFAEKFRAAAIVPAEIMDELFAAYQRIKAVYPHDTADYVSCHNDLKPENIIYDGVKPWPVDWEGAFLNDRYCDLAVVGNFVADDEAEEKAFLAAYFNAPPTAYQYARFVLMQQLMHFFYFTFFAQISAGGKPVDMSEPVPPFRQFHDGMWNGEITMKDNGPRLQYARVHLQRLQENIKTARFEEALKVVGANTGRLAP